MAPQREFSAQAKEALNAFASRNGRYWKSRLREAWLTGNYRRYGADVDEAAALQRIRNDPQLTVGMLRYYKPTQVDRSE